MQQRFTDKTKGRFDDRHRQIVQTRSIAVFKRFQQFHRAHSYAQDQNFEDMKTSPVLDINVKTYKLG